MPQSINAHMRSLLDVANLHLATTWKIERTDGFVLRFTDHNAPLVLADNETYTPVDGVDASALRKESGLEDQGRDVHAIVSSSQITADDLRAGRYRNAKVTERVVDWRFPFDGYLGTYVYWMTSTEWDGDKLTAQAQGIAAKLQNEAGQSYGMECQWDLGAAFGQSYAGCKVDLSSYTAAFLYIGYDLGYVVDRRSWHLKYDTTGQPWDVDGFFSLGKARFESGQNEGLEMDIRVHTRTDANDWDIELMFDMPFDIDETDQVTLTPGCNKISGISNADGHCKNRFSALEYFGGFPYIPGTDKSFQIPRK